ncbi:MAG: PAS domain S-box protein [Bacteroidota bacterium]|nr:PAS domain S-box protein [Bacteroidota bacterium]
MKATLRVLMIDDSEDDALLLLHQLNKSDYTIEHIRVDTAKDFTEALKNHAWDIILSDYKMPHFNGSDALKLFKKMDIDIPFIIVSGTIGEEIAVEIMKAGAQDYIMKNNLKRLLPTIDREIRESKNRAARKHLEEQQKKSGKALVEQSRVLESFFKHTQTCLVFLDKEFNFIRVNEAYARVCQRDASSFIGHNHFELYPSDELKSQFEHVVQTKKTYQVLSRPFTFPDHPEWGTSYWDLTLTPVLNNENEIEYLVFSLVDTTERKLAEEKITRAKEEWEHTFDAISDPIMVLDNDFKIVKTNVSMAAALKKKPEETIGMTCYKEVHGCDSPPSFCPHAKLLIDGQPHTNEIQEQKLGGDFIVAVSPLQSSDGTVYGSIHIARNITERKQMERALRESENKYRKIFENVQDIFYQTNLSGTITEISPSIERYAEYTRAELIGRPVTDVYHNPKDRDTLMQIMKTKGEVVDYELRLKAKNDRLIYVSVNAHILFGADGKPAGTEGSLRDITQRKHAEREMSMLSQAIKSVSECVSVTDDHDIILFVNAAFLKTYGYAKEELIGKNISIVRSEKNPSSVVSKILPSTIEGRWEGELWNKKKDGTDFLVHLSTSSVKDDRSNIVALIGVAKDITEQRKAEETLRESEERYRNLFEQDSTGDFMSTIDGTLIDCNPSFVKIFGFDSKQEALKTNITSIYKTPEERKDFLDLLRAKKKIEGYELEFRNTKGKTVYAIKNAIGIFDKNGDLEKIQGYIFDDTERKILRQQLIQSQKIESLGVLAGGIAHDFNNILGIILGYVSLLKMGTYSREQLQNSLETITNAINRGAGLVKQILTFARKTDVIYGFINANSMIKEFAKILAETFPKTIVVTLKLDDQLPSTILDETQFHQALLNLCVNARDAMPNGGTLTIETKLVTRESILRQAPEASEEQYLCVSVTDTGTGMNKETRDRIFEPFFTTKEKGKGTGLGLPVVYGVVKSHKGFVALESEEGKGTTFYLYFPFSAESEETTTIRKRSSEEIKGGTETILLVEDEEALIFLIQVLLESKGYRVLTVGDGIEAVEFYRQHKSEIDLVVTDIGLPRLTGDEVFLEMKKINPDLKLMLASGYLEPEKRSELLQSGAKDFVQKPYEPDEVLMKIRRVLDT